MFVLLFMYFQDDSKYIVKIAHFWYFDTIGLQTTSVFDIVYDGNTAKSIGTKMATSNMSENAREIMKKS